jgi:hypothetical protein
MNWSIIFLLSLFGLAMSLATVFWIRSRTEPFFWLVIFIICAIIIARFCSSDFFLHGLLVSIVNSIWIISAHLIFFKTYISNHPREAEMLARKPKTPPRLMMIITGLLIGILSGSVLGLFSFAASKIIK